MLGLGTDILHQSSLVAQTQQALEIVGIEMSDAPNTSKVSLSGAFAASSALGTVSGVSSASVGDKLGGTYSLEIIRFSAGSVLEEALTFTVHIYLAATVVGDAATFYASTVDSSSLAPSTFNEGGSSLIDFDTLGISDDAADHLYKATLTVSQSGFISGSATTGSQLVSMITE